MYIAILGRQPALGIAELEQVYKDVRWFSDTSALVETDHLNLARLGGTPKAGRVVAKLPHGDWLRASMKIVQTYTKQWAAVDGKITLGISAYGFDTTTSRDVQKTGIILKSKLKEKKVSIRLIPNAEPALNTATSHHNKLGLSDNKVELLVVRAHNGNIIIAESIGAQNITMLAKRDQERPRRDAFVGMLPPKLAQIMINLATPEPSQLGNLSSDPLTPPTPQGVARGSEGMVAELSDPLSPDLTPLERERTTREGDKAAGEENGRPSRILDPFCGTGVILQEAALMGYSVYGTDLSEKMVRYSRDNINWLQDTFHMAIDWYLHEGDAMTTAWQSPIDAVVCESYLGQPFSAPPSAAKLTEVRGNCDHIISNFLKNLAPQLQTGTPVCIGVPAWRSTTGTFTHLPLISKLETLGYKRHMFKNVSNQDLLYFREDQVVARELLVLTKA